MHPGFSKRKRAWLATGMLVAGCDASVSVSLPLIPALDPAVTDYVVRCDGTPLAITATGDRGASVRVNGSALQVGETQQLALAPGGAFTLDIPHGASTRRHHVRCLPSDFPQFTIERPGTPMAQFYVAAIASYVAVFDAQGVPVWWKHALPGNAPVMATLLPNGHFAWQNSNASMGPNVEEYQPDGTAIRAPHTVGDVMDGHELQLTASGDYVLPRYFLHDDFDVSSCAGKAEKTQDNDIQVVSPDGKLLFQWIATEHVALEETVFPGICAGGQPPYDLHHINSIEPTGDALIASFRHLNAVYKIARGSGEIIWKLGGSPRPESLTVIGDPLLEAGESLLSGQHDARLLDDGTLTVHDNRTQQPTQRPRALRFAIDEVARTATLLESVVDPDVPSSPCCGSARKLPGGNWVMSWGRNHSFTELTADAQRVLRINFDESAFTHRAVPLLPGRIAIEALRAGMDAQL